MKQKEILELIKEFETTKKIIKHILTKIKRLNIEEMEKRFTESSRTYKIDTLLELIIEIIEMEEGDKNE